MDEQSPDLSREMLRTGQWQALTNAELDAIRVALRKVHVTRDPSHHLDARTMGERLSDRIAAFGGSWTFVTLFLLFIVGWALLNTDILAPRKAAFDPYPYVFLNLMLSMVAALQAPIIMMTQNRLATRDRLDAQNDYEVNFKAELEVRALHEKLDLLRDVQWAELVRMQERQIQLLERAVGGLPGSSPGIPEL